jgi:hypothetical protein
MVRQCSPCQQRMLAGGTEDKEHAMSQKLDTSPAVIGIDIGKSSFHSAIFYAITTSALPSNVAGSSTPNVFPCWLKIDDQFNLGWLLDR